MKTIIVFLILMMSVQVFSQNKGTYRTGITAEENLRAISSISPTSGGGIGFDTRYRGVKGSPMLYDSLHTSYLKIEKQEKYLQIESNIDLISNCVRFFHPKTKEPLAVPASNVEELIISKGDSDIVFRVMKGTQLKRKSDEPVLYQVMNDDQFKLIKLPVKEFMEADYKPLYSSGRQYDEFYLTHKYFITSPDGSVRQCQLNEKSLVKLFPDKKDLIKKAASEKKYANREQMVVEILKSF
jgi:hypothetical protein